MASHWDDFIASMLAKHYDPAYERSMFTNYANAREATTLETTDISPAGFVALGAALPR
jgi:hypothetical protein